MNAATKTPTAKSLIRTFTAVGFSACKVETMNGDGVQVWTADLTRVADLCDLVKKTGLEWQGSDSCWTVILRKADMLVPPTRRPF